MSANPPIANDQGTTGLRAGETPEQRAERLAWWKEARFGMFIHWGLYAKLGGEYQGPDDDKPRRTDWIGEWIMNSLRIPVAEYKSLATDWNPQNWDAQAIVRLAKQAGMKYIVITTKHHEGFAIYDSDVSDWNIHDATPMKRDPIAELAEACRRHGLKLGFYYSHNQDWCHPGGDAWGSFSWRGKKEFLPGCELPDGEGRWCSGCHWDKAQLGDYDEYLRTVALPQVEEILTKYGRIDIVWFDTPRVRRPAATREQMQPFLDLVEKHQPHALINNRLGAGIEGDYRTPEQEIPDTGLDYEWETCMTMNESWGYKSFDHDWKSPEEILWMLVDITSKGGNFLFNIGPDGMGNIPAPSVSRLLAVGEWMETHGEAIYGCGPSLLEGLPDGIRSSTKVDEDGHTRIFLFIKDWPKDGKLEVSGVSGEPVESRLLGSEVGVEARVVDEGLVVEGLPQKPPHEMVSVLSLSFTEQPVLRPGPEQ
ncbi:alpha-L-fucosidase [Haloferula sp. A504]|uniref:alpha-L-fucosidase n=1 Tax=Haloferula sp. A504 TaxID=3373601 RepID=UPI0031C70C36|nr:alpha-L-fucosidase [Verrucomicrobiaceae bacterium E54]